MLSKKRSTYVQLKEELKGGAALTAIYGRGERFTCRVAVNAGLELLIAGADFLKMHGISKDAVMEFIGLVFDAPGDIEDMHKGGKNEPLLRAAMKIINGTIIPHDGSGAVVDGVDETHDDAVILEPVTQRKLNPVLN